MLNKSDLWSIAHSNNDVLQENVKYSKASFDSEIGWLKYLITETPNGSILKNNVLYDTVRARDKIYLAHVTRSYKSLMETGKILSSSGCLIGSVYCTPVVKDGNKLRLHNLGEYIFKKEAPAFSKDKDDVALLLIELEFPPKITNFPVGVNYLKLGAIHFSIFSELSYLLSNAELLKLKSNAITAIQKTESLLNIIDEFPPEAITKNFENFYELYRKSISELPILGYFLFEALCEYIALFQKGPEVNRCHQVNEIYCSNFKNLIYAVCPSLTRSFNLGLFQPKFSDIKKYLTNIKMNADNNRLFFEDYITRRLHYFINDYFYNSNSDINTRKSFWQNIEWGFEYLQYQLMPLLGHIIHRLLRNMHRFPNFFFYFDQYKALQVWNYWNNVSIALPYNAVLPKGEIGINPANPYMRYKVFSTKLWQENGYCYIAPEKKLPLAIEPRLAEIDILFMRKK